LVVVHGYRRGEEEEEEEWKKLHFIRD